MKRLAAALAVGAICALPSAAAGAVENVRDGGFEGSTCDAAECSNPAWEEGLTTAFSNATGPICRSGTGAGNTDCDGGGSAPFSGSTWARFGAGFKASAMFGGGVSSFLDQSVPIPTGPATLTFRLRIIDAPIATGEFTVEVGGGDLPGTQVFSVTDSTPGFASYAPVTIDLSSRVGTTPRIRLQGFSARDPIGALDSFDVDDVSLISPDPRCLPLRAKLRKLKKAKPKSKKAKKAKKRRIRKVRKSLRALGC